MKKERGMREQICFCVVLFCAMILLSSCAKRSDRKKHDRAIDMQDVDRQRSLILDKIIQQEAMLVNVPIPLYDERILPTSLDVFESETIVLGYKSILTVQQITDFFMNQMERYGWKHVVSFQNGDIILFFENPDAYMSVVIRLLEKYSSSFFIYIKRAN